MASFEIKPYPGDPDKYGPVNCHVAKELNETLDESEILKPCERCGSAAPTLHCLFYDRKQTGSWETKPQFKPNRPFGPATPIHEQAKIEDHPDYIAAAGTMSNARKVTRIQRAKIADLLETCVTPRTETELNEIVTLIVRVLDEY